MLAELGARVIKIENPQAATTPRHFEPFVNGQSAYFAFPQSRQGEHCPRPEEGRGTAPCCSTWCAAATFLVENYRPGTLDRLGLGYDRLKEINPG